MGDQALAEAFYLIEKLGVYQPPKPLSPTATNELEMWHNWNNGGRKPEDLRPLVQSLQPLVNNRMKLYRNSLRDIPQPVVESEFHNKLLGALATYDPNKGRMSTHVTNHLKQVDRFIKSYQNDARASEELTGYFGKHTQAVNHLREVYGREPTTHEISDHMGIPVNRVVAIQKQNVPSYLLSRQQEDPREYIPSRTQEMVHLMQYELDHEELPVFEHLHGINGKPQLTASQIAKELNMSPAKVTRVKDRIAKKWQAYDY
jgi:DNA-directed RNA polymerase specialized sigma subunit